MGKVFILIIKFYQKVVSPDQGIFRYIYNNKYQHCLMYPTCSQYMIVSIDKFGVFKGVIKGVRRIFRCHPYQKKLIDLP